MTDDEITKLYNEAQAACEKLAEALAERGDERFSSRAKSIGSKIDADHHLWYDCIVLTNTL